MGILIDSSWLIQHERAGGSFEEARADESVFISVITVSELLHGVHRARTPGQRAKRSAFVEAVITAIPALPIDLATARMHAGLWADLMAQGIQIGAHDLWIAATAVARDLSVLTLDRSAFERIPGITLESPRGKLG